MIGTRRGLAILLGVAALLATFLLFDLRRRSPAVVDRTLVPGLDPERITELTWDRPPAPAVTVTLRDEVWRWSSSGVMASAEPGVIRDLIATLRAAHWHRRAEVAAAGPLHGQLSLTLGPGTVVTAASPVRVIGIGAPLAGTEQTWLVVGEHALLVDSWVVRALDPDPLALRLRRPVKNAARIMSLTLGTDPTTSIVSGMRQLTPRRMFVRADLIDRVHRAIEQLEILRLSGPPGADSAHLTISLEPLLRVGPTCVDDPTLAWLASDVGDGCIARASYDELAALANLFNGPPEPLIEPRPNPGALLRVVLADGAVLRLDRRAAIDDKPADPAAVSELLAALSAPGEVTAVPDRVPVRGTLKLKVSTGSDVTLELLGGNLVRREDEPLALRLTPVAYAVLTRGAVALADRSVWNEEPTTISALKVDGVTYSRGAVIGEWSRTPPGTVDGAKVEALVAALASPRRSPDVEAFSVGHTITLTVTGPTGAPIHHELSVGARRGAVCICTASNATVLLPAAHCATVDLLAR